MKNELHAIYSYGSRLSSVELANINQNGFNVDSHTENTNKTQTYDRKEKLFRKIDTVQK